MALAEAKAARARAEVKARAKARSEKEPEMIRCFIVGMFLELMLAALMQAASCADQHDE